MKAPWTICPHTGIHICVRITGILQSAELRVQWHYQCNHWDIAIFPIFLEIISVVCEWDLGVMVTQHISNSRKEKHASLFLLKVYTLTISWASLLSIKWTKKVNDHQNSPNYAVLDGIDPGSESRDFRFSHETTEQLKARSDYIFGQIRWNPACSVLIVSSSELS